MYYSFEACCVGTSILSACYDTSGGVEAGGEAQFAFTSRNEQMLLSLPLIKQSINKSR